MVLGRQYKLQQLEYERVGIYFENEKIQFVNKIKYLGFYVDEVLNFKAHFEYISNKIRQKLFMFSRISLHLSMYARLTVYRTIIQPHFEYCSSLLYLMDLNCINGLQKLQNRGMRLVLRVNRYTPVRDMLSTLDWQNVANRLYYLTMVFLFKLSKGLLPSYFDQFITLNSEVHNYITRHRNDYYLERTNTKSGMKSLFFKGLQSFNRLPVDLRSCNTVRQFKRDLYGFIREHGIIN